MTIGQGIQQLRREKGLSQEALGEALGVSRQAVSKWESDLTLPEIDNLIAMSRLFQVPVGVLLGEEARSDSPNSEAEPEPAPDRAAAGPPKRRVWPWVLAGAVLIFIAVVGLFVTLTMRGPGREDAVSTKTVLGRGNGAPLWLEAESSYNLDLDQAASACLVTWRLEGRFCTDGEEETYLPASAALRVYRNGELAEETPLELSGPDARFSLYYRSSLPVSAGDELRFLVEATGRSGGSAAGELAHVTFEEDQRDGSLTFLAYSSTDVEFNS